MRQCYKNLRLSMFRSFCIVCLLIPIIAESDLPKSEENSSIAKKETSAYISNPTSFMVIKRQVEYLKKKIDGMENITAKKAYDYFSKQKKEINDKNLLEIYYSVISFLKIQPNITPKTELQTKLKSLLDHLSWLYSDHKDDNFSNQITHFGSLINPDVFIHLNHKKMSECLNSVRHLKDIIKYSNLGNDLTPSDFFLQKEINSAQEIYSQVTSMERLALDFSKYCETLSKEQLTANIINANHLINQLKFVNISLGKDKKNVRISRNTRKHLQNLIFSSIKRLINQRNQLN